MAETLPTQEVTAASLPSERQEWPDPWRQARRAAIVALVLPGLVLCLLGLDGWLRGGRPERDAACWMGRLGTSAPALWPAGDARHYPPESAP